MKFIVEIPLSDIHRESYEDVSVILENIAKEVRRRGRNMPSWIFQDFERTEEISYGLERKRQCP